MDISLLYILNCFNAGDFYITILSENKKWIKSDSETIDPVKELAKIASVTPNVNFEFINLKPSPKMLKYFCEEARELKGFYSYHNGGLGDVELE